MSNHMAPWGVEPTFFESSGIAITMQLWEHSNSQSDMRYLGTRGSEEPSATRSFLEVCWGAWGTILEIAFGAFSFPWGCIVLQTTELSHPHFRTPESPLQYDLEPRVLGCYVIQDFMESLRNHSLESLRTPWNPWGFHGILKDSVESLRISWNPSRFQGILKDSMECLWIPWNP